MIADLHTHTTASDGSLAPCELLDHATTAGVDMLAITDHDTTAAYRDLPEHAHPGLTIIRGIELSTSWQRQGIHVLGLRIDIDSEAMLSACRTQSAARRERAEYLAERLRRRGILDAYAGAAAIAGDSALGRPHFARYLVDIGAASSARQAFSKYLGGRHDGASTQHWASLEQTIAWIHAANGCAVLAHPAKYGLTNSRLERLLGAFKAAGGDALEVVSGMQREHVTRHLAQLARRHGLSVSLGSDFHHPNLAWAALGRFPALPDGLRPVWDSW